MRNKRCSQQKQLKKLYIKQEKYNRVQGSINITFVRLSNVSHLFVTYEVVYAAGLCKGI